MTSKIAKSTIEKWQSEGLNPTFDDIVLLNALGLKAERTSDMYCFAACPRISFLGDWVLREPTVGKRAWMDEAKQLLNDDFRTHLYFTAWALNCPDNELPKLTKAKYVLDEVKKFAQEVLVDFTITQILMAIDYALNGDDYVESYTPEEKEAKAEVTVPPSEIMSEARHLISEALTQGMSSEVKDFVTVPQLEKMIVCAAMNNGADVMKDIKNNALGAFYVAAGKTHTRLIEEKKAKEDGKEQHNT